MEQRPSVLIVVDSDPHVSARPAEAARIALGVAAWKQADVSLCLSGPAAAALTEWPEDLVEGESFQHHLASFVEAGGRVFTHKPSSDPAVPKGPEVPREQIDVNGLADLSRTASQLLRF